MDLDSLFFEEVPHSDYPATIYVTHSDGNAELVWQVRSLTAGGEDRFGQHMHTRGCAALIQSGPYCLDGNLDKCQWSHEGRI